MRLEEKLGCFGYYGFGSGYELPRRRERLKREGKAGAMHGAPTYCDLCHRREECWRRHQARTRAIWEQAHPALWNFFLELVTQHRDAREAGKKILDGWIAMIQEAASPRMRASGNVVPPPDVAEQTANIQCGMNHAFGSPLETEKTRGRPGALTWPLPVLEPLPDGVDPYEEVG